MPRDRRCPRPLRVEEVATRVAWSGAVKGGAGTRDFDPTTLLPGWSAVAGEPAAKPLLLTVTAVIAAFVFPVYAVIVP